MIDSIYYFDERKVYLNDPDTDVEKHIVYKGIFMEEHSNEHESILLTVCGKYAWFETPKHQEYDLEVADIWDEIGGCEACKNAVNKRTFHSWLVSDKFSDKLNEKLHTEEDEL